MGEYEPEEGSRPAKRARYSDRIEDIRREEYPMLNGTTYLDHAATTPAPASLLAAFSKDLTQNLYGNPHSGSASSQSSTRRIDDTRLRVLRFFNADPVDFDVVFVANATAGVKLVADAFRDAGDEQCEGGFEYLYHNEVHTSLVGVRDMAKAGSICLQDAQAVNGWLRNEEETQTRDDVQSQRLRLFAYPGQSNMNGHRPDPDRQWCRQIQRIRKHTSKPIYSLFDAAGLVSTSPLDLSDSSCAPDFTVLSFYKIFGFPDIGALIVRKASGGILNKRRYFGGGTMEMVISGDEPWQSRKTSSFHDRLEDGTLPFHSIIALDLAMKAHKRIYGSMKDISSHTGRIAKAAAERLNGLRHGNGEKVCNLFCPPGSYYGRGGNLGPVIAFNIKDSKGIWIGKSDVEKLASVRNIQLRTGTLCNPGGAASYLGLSASDMRSHFAKGQRCGDEHDLMDGRPTGVIRISFGAMSSTTDIDTFITFLKEFYVDRAVPLPSPTPTPSAAKNFYVESLCVFPIKSCAGYKVPASQLWEVHPEGLAWDREWCLVHQLTKSALSQKRYPRMALLRPEIDLEKNILKIFHSIEDTSTSVIEIPLSRSSESNLSPATTNICTKSTSSKVCGDTIDVQLYTSIDITSFFTEALGVPCMLARFPPKSTPRLMKLRDNKRPPFLRSKSDGRSILLSNESPMLLVSRSSVNRLNENIKSFHGTKGVGKAVPADSFRGNIVIAQTHIPGVPETPFVEDTWKALTISSPTPSSYSNIPEDGKQDERKSVQIDVLAPCQRCQMVSINQKSGEKHPEPFSALAKTRKWDGGIWFGMHLCLSGENEKEREPVFMKVGDVVIPE